MKYIIAPSYREGDIIHSASRTQRANHKYIDRVMGKNGKWQYIYTRAEAKTRRGVSNIANALNRAKNKGAQILREDRDFYNDLGKKAVNTLNKAKNKGAQILREDRDFYNDLGKKASGAINRLKKNSGNAIKKKLNKGLDWLENNKIFSIYDKTSMKSPYTGKVTVLSKKKKRFKTR